MDPPVEKPPLAWQPLTARGVAAFARGSCGRLLVVQLIFALLAAVTVIWFLRTAWFPTITEAIRQLPPGGEIRSGRLDWRGDSPQRLAEGRFLALAVDLQHKGQTRSPAHMQVEFGQNDLKIFSLFGSLQGGYPRGYVVAFNRAELEPWWGAWRPPLLGGVALLVVSGLLLIWSFLATLYCLPVWLIGFFANRNLSLAGSWRLAGAALMPGALLQTAAILFYGLGLLDPLHLAAATGVHVVIGWIYLVLSPLALPRDPSAASLRGNPFVTRPGAKTNPTAENQPVKSPPPQSGG